MNAVKVKAKAEHRVLRGNFVEPASRPHRSAEGRFLRPESPPAAPGKRAIHGCSRADLADRFQAWGEPGWRLDQLLEWLYLKRAAQWDEMTNLPKGLRAKLGDTFEFGLPNLIRREGSTDTTEKFLWRFRDGALVECVLIPASPALYGERADRNTLCVSTQVGCAYGCRFCASGLEGWKRNLGPDEIVTQVLAVERWRTHASQPSPALADAPDFQDKVSRLSRSPTARCVDNLVIMGMGEPLANYDNLLAALRILNAPWGGGIGARRITISTSGLAPQIRRLAEEPEQFRLALSLHGATDAVRDRIMPVNRKYPISELTAACEAYLQRKGRMISFEYILLAGVNDALENVPALASLARRLHARVNLIPYNPVEGLPWSRPQDAHCQAFADALTRAGITATVRREKGGDILAACGQLRLKTEHESGGPPMDMAVRSP